MKRNHQQYTDQFMECYDQYADDIFRFCMVKTKDRSLSLDITQETFMKFWEYLVKGTDIEQERPLLYRMAKNLIIDNYRKKKAHQVEDFSEGSYMEHLQENPQERMENQIDGEQALLLIEQLPPSTQEIVSLRFIQDLSISEIASVTGKDPKKVSVYLHRGIQRLREILSELENHEP